MTASALVEIENTRHRIKEERLTEFITFRRNCILKHFLQMKVEEKNRGEEKARKKMYAATLSEQGDTGF